MITYLSCGNSDDKLKQQDWASLLDAIEDALQEAQVSWIGAWYSAPRSAFQNACFAFTLDEEYHPELKGEMRALAVLFRQDAITWANAPVTEFLGPEMQHTLNHPNSDRWTGGDKKDEK